MANEDNVLTKLGDLLLYLVPQLDKFPRSQKFVLGDRIQVKVMEVQECYLRATGQFSHLLHGRAERMACI